MTKAPPATDAAREDTTAAESSRRRGGSAWLIVLLLIGAGLAGLYLWNELQRARTGAAAADAWRLEAEALAARLDSLDRRLQQLGSGQRAIDARLGDVGANQGVIRAELLAASERAATIEDAVARLSDQRLRGDTLLKLNEIESLLVLAGQRLQLARDVDGARTALQAASAVLEGLDDPLYAGLKLPLAAERELLAMLPPDPLPQVRGTVAATLAALPGLPRAAAIEPERDTSQDTSGRMLQALSGLIRVRPRDDGDRALAGSARAAALEALRLDLRAALAAAEARDPAALAAALERAQRPIARLFDAQTAPVQALQARLQAIDPQALSAPMPALGATLGELRALRGSRPRLQATAAAGAPMQTPSPTPPQAPAAAEETAAADAGSSALELDPSAESRGAPESESESESELAPEPELELELEATPDPESERSSTSTAADARA